MIFIVPAFRKLGVHLVMGLPPLEYSDCFLDSPSFREIITLYEQELESNAKVVKTLVRECNNMIQKTEGEFDLYANTTIVQK